MFRNFFHRSASAVLALLLAVMTVMPAMAAAPLNDNFADAQQINSLPLAATVDITEANLESSESLYCWGGSMDHTVWYSFTPDHDMAVQINVLGSAVNADVNLYLSTDGTMNGLNFMGCTYFSNTSSFFLQANQTYYLQAGSLFGGLGNIHINLNEFTPPPVQPNFNFYPSDPSPYDVVQFCDNSSDPGGFGFSSFTWDFGDGATSTSNCAAHQYAKDGDYTVQHTVTTVDGRTGSTSQVVHIRTYDVAITKISAPQSASSGQTRSITVTISNKSYATNVRVELLKSVPGGYQSIGSYYQFVPARSSGRTVTFTFNYTFTSADASMGKVTFRAVAYLDNVRDFFPADNEAISSPPTKVGK